MKKKPKGVLIVDEVEGDKEIIVIIPTADFDVKYAIECRENIFKGLHIAFVENTDVGDSYLNFAQCSISEDNYLNNMIIYSWLFS